MDTVSLIGRLLVSLAFVLGLMWLLARRVKRTGRGKNGGLIDVVGRQQLSRNASITVVRVAERALILGVTDGQVSVLGETQLADVEQRLDTAAAARPARGRARTEPAASRRTVRTARAQRAASRRITRAEPAAAARDASSGSCADNHALAETADPTARRGPLAGSALSPNTWRQTLESLRELTARSR